MRTVFKYPIEPNSIQGKAYPIEINAPRGAVPLSVAIQGGQVCLWAQVDTTNPVEDQVPLVCVGTGFGEVPYGAMFLQTLLQGPYVWHFYRPVKDPAQ